MAAPVVPRLRPDLACRRLAQAVAARLGKPEGRSWRAEAFPERDGGLLFRFGDARRALTLRWQGFDGRTLGALPGAFVIIESQGEGFEQAVLDTLATVLGLVVSTVSWAPLAPVCRQAPLVTEIPPLAQLLARTWLVPGQSGWGDYVLRDVVGQGDAIALTFAAGPKCVALRITKAAPRPAGADDRHAMRFAHFEVEVARDDRSDADRRAMGHQVERAVAFALTRIIPSGATSGQPSRADPDPDRAWQVALRRQLRESRGSSLNAILSPPELAWRQFLAEDEMAHFVHLSWETTGDSAFVMHSDRGCVFMRPFVNAELSRFINYPKKLVMSKGYKIVSTLLSDGDVVTDGSEARLLELTDDLARDSSQHGTIVLDDTCIPKLLGQDQSALKAELGGRYKTPVLQCFPGAAFGRHEDGINQLFSDLFAGRTRTRIDERPTVALVGFHLDTDLTEITDMLCEVGVEVTATLLPNLDLAHVERFLSARLQVQRASSFLASVYERTFDPMGVPALVRASPCGVEGTRAWAEAVCEALGMTALWEHRWAGRAAQQEALVASWKARSAGFDVAFVLDVGQLSFVWDPARAFGVSLVGVLREIGFDVVAHVFEDTGDEARRAFIAQEARALLRESGHDPSSLGLVFFASEAELDRLLAAGDVRLVFTDYHGDPRVTRAGKSWFSLGDFEMGFDGAERTAERLLHRAGTPFWARLRASQAEVAP